MLDEIVRYIGFSQVDQDALRRLHDDARRHFDSIADEFYDRILAHDDARHVLRNTGQVERLKVTMSQWLDRLLSGPWDQEYYEMRLRIGRKHVQVKLPQRYMFTAMSLIHCRLIAIAEATCGDDHERRQATMQALARVCDMELTIMLESYREDYIDAVRRYEQMETQLLQHRLEISEARYQAVIETGEIMVIAVDREGKVVLFNHHAEQTSGYARDTMLGQPWLTSLCHPDDRVSASGAMERALAGHVTTMESRIVTRDGGERWVKWHVTPLVSSENRSVCAMGVDITDERELEQRTQRAEQLAALGTLAAGLAHEIRNPLNAAQLQLMLADKRVRLLAADHPGDNGSRALGATQVVREELQRLATLVEDFLAFARPTALRVSSHNVSELIESVASLVEGDIALAGVKATVTCGEPVTARVDKERITQVLLNLIRNAVDATGPGGEIGITLASSEQAAILEVLDNGPGLPDGMDVFEPFATTKDAGTGLGLPIVQRIITDHGGAITVDRRDDRTVFRISLPLTGPS